MNLSIREQIIRAAIVAMTPVAQTYNATIFRSPAVAVERNQLPAIIVAPDKIEVKKVNSAMERTMVLRVTAIAKRDEEGTCDALVDQISSELCRVMATVQNFDGLCQALRETEVEFEVDEADVAISALPACFEVVFRTRVDDPTVKG
jgi:hypothetical protein